MALVTTTTFPAILSTRITNASGGSRFFGYLGKHGATLADGDTYVEEGDLIAKLSGHNGAAQRLRDAFSTDLKAGDITIDQSPLSIDESLTVGVAIGSYNGTPVELALSTPATAYAAPV